MNLFETIKEKVSVPDAAKRYGLRTAHHDMAICPFHDDRHPSLRLNRDYFYWTCQYLKDKILAVTKREQLTDESLYNDII